MKVSNLNKTQKLLILTKRLQTHSPIQRSKILEEFQITERTFRRWKADLVGVGVQIRSWKCNKVKDKVVGTQKAFAIAKLSELEESDK